MLTELLLIAGAGFLGLKALENPDKAKAVTGKLLDESMKMANKNYANGKMSDVDYQKMKNDYSRLQAKAGEWQVESKMKDFMDETGYDQNSAEYQGKLEELYEKRNEFDKRLAYEEEKLQDKMK